MIKVNKSVLWLSVALQSTVLRHIAFWDLQIKCSSDVNMQQIAFIIFFRIYQLNAHTIIIVTFYNQVFMGDFFRRILNSLATLDIILKSWALRCNVAICVWIKFRLYKTLMNTLYIENLSAQCNINFYYYNGENTVFDLIKSHW